MPKTNWQQSLQLAAKHLAKHDPVLAPLIKRYGLCTITPHANYYQELVSSIISQQLSIKAANTIERRFVDLFGGQTFPSAKAILTKDVEALRQAGLSRAKAGYIRDLAVHIESGQVKIDHLPKLSNDEVMAELIKVKGIGEWTAHMFLMFSLGRLDVLATGDLGIRTGIKKLYDLKSLPAATDIREISQKYCWHPYETVACWYIWRALDNAPKLPEV